MAEPNDIGVLLSDVCTGTPLTDGKVHAIDVLADGSRCSRSGAFVKILLNGGTEFCVQCGGCGAYFTLPVVEGRGVQLPEHEVSR